MGCNIITVLSVSQTRKRTLHNKWIYQRPKPMNTSETWKRKVFMFQLYNSQEGRARWHSDYPEQEKNEVAQACLKDG